MAYSVEYRETLRFERGSPRHVQPATETIMQKIQLKGVPASVLRADEDAYFGLKTITGYKPPNDAYSLEAVTSAYEAYRTHREAEAIAAKALAAARDALSITESSFHDAITGAKTQVRAIYGEDSDELAALGLKKKSEKKTGGRGGKKGAGEG